MRNIDLILKQEGSAGNWRSTEELLPKNPSDLCVAIDEFREIAQTLTLSLQQIIKHSNKKDSNNLNIILTYDQNLIQSVFVWFCREHKLFKFKE